MKNKNSIERSKKEYNVKFIQATYIKISTQFFNKLSSKFISFASEFKSKFKEFNVK